MKRIGFLYPGYSAEDEYPRMQELLPAGIELALVHTSVGEDLHEVEALLDLGKSARLLEGTQQLQSQEVDAIMWACTSGSFVFGVEGARQQAQEIADFSRLPASSTSLAFVAAIRSIGIKRVSIAATYPSEVTAKFVEFLQDSEISVTQTQSHEVLTAALAGDIPADSVTEMVEAANHPDAEAILVPDTALHTVDLVADLEAQMNKVILTANQVTLWQGLQLIDSPQQIPHLGRLFAGDN